MPSSVSLPELHLSSTTHGLDVILRPSVELAFSGELRIPRTSAELLDLVAREHLWIARRGACFLRCSVLLDGALTSGDAQIRELTTCIQGCEFWDRLGIRLHYDGGGHFQSPGEMGFSIQHPDLSSALVPPRDALTADFVSVTCAFEVVARDEVPAPVRPCKRRKRRAAGLSGLGRERDEEVYAGIDPDDSRAIEAFLSDLRPTCSRGSGGDDGPDGELYADLVAEDQQAVDDFMLGLGTPKTPQTVERHHQSHEFDHYREMMEAALRMLVLGKDRFLKDIVVLRKHDPSIESDLSITLTKLAPGVFFIPYLKAVSDRAGFLPVIAQSLSRMRHSESPSLRQKVASLMIAADDDQEAGESERAVRGLERTAWDVLLANLRKPRLRAQPAAQRTGNRGDVDARATENQGLDLTWDATTIVPSEQTPDSQAHRQDPRHQGSSEGLCEVQDTLRRPLPRSQEAGSSSATDLAHLPMQVYEPLQGSLDSTQPRPAVSTQVLGYGVSQILGDSSSGLSPGVAGHHSQAMDLAFFGQGSSYLQLPFFGHHRV